MAQDGFPGDGREPEGRPLIVAGIRAPGTRDVGADRPSLWSAGACSRMGHVLARRQAAALHIRIRVGATTTVSRPHRGQLQIRPKWLSKWSGKAAARERLALGVPAQAGCTALGSSSSSTRIAPESSRRRCHLAASRRDHRTSRSPRCGRRSKGPRGRCAGS